MKKITLVLIFLIVARATHAQSEQPLDSKITDVTVFLSKAQVTRTAKSKVTGGRTTLVVSGLTSLLDPQSIQVSGKGKIVIEGISHRQNYLNEFNTPVKLRTLRDSAETLQRKISFQQIQKEILNKEEQMILGNQKIGGAQTTLTVVDLEDMADFYRTRLIEIASLRTQHDEQMKHLNQQLTKLHRQIQEQNELYTRNTSEIVITVSAEVPTSIELQIVYVATNAGWQPVYDLRAINTKAPIRLSYKANVSQNTGEEWKNVNLTLSTANPNESGLKPELYTWLLDFYQPQVYSKSREGNMAMKRTMAAPEAVAMEETTDAEITTLADFTHTVQTSLNTAFEIGMPQTIVSANKTTLVDIRNHELKAAYVYSAVPKLDRDAFLIAKASGWEEFSLLPGEANIFFEGTFVGKSFIDPNTIGDTLSVSLGRDKRIVIKREELKDFKSKKLIGTNQRNSYAYELSVRNTKTEPVKIKLEDQIPVSKNSQIEVTATDTGGGAYTKETGKLTWDITLQPNDTKRVQFKYEIKYPKDKQVSGLE